MAEELHPLQNEWVIWEHKANTGSKDPAKWKENMKQLCEFSTVEGFWQYFSHLPKPSEVFFDGDCKKKVSDAGSGTDGDKTVEEYSLFKKGIEPEWGDPQNVIGGEWFCRQFFEADVLDLYWTNLVMACIGETIEDAVDDEGAFQSYINGARVVDKSRNFPLYKIEIWLNTRDPIIKERIKDKLMDVLTDGQQTPSRKMQPKFDWRDHTA
ncbi:translation initiation factor 4E [Nitzschia inconspicua]|uniref:Translation initiation factor 4E n=1 Tax=Nitzschia inconspicua TaxID=303405 RepID=A0A9K3LG45_9STRA|nr:translation initiation factor 4E [Nitzschia inconspicua]